MADMYIPTTVTTLLKPTLFCGIKQTRRPSALYSSNCRLWTTNWALTKQRKCPISYLNKRFDRTYYNIARSSFVLAASSAKTTGSHRASRNSQWDARSCLRKVAIGRVVCDKISSRKLLANSDFVPAIFSKTSPSKWSCHSSISTKFCRPA